MTLHVAELARECVDAGAGFRVAVLVRGAADVAAGAILGAADLAAVGRVQANQRGEIVIAARAAAVATRLADPLAASAGADNVVLRRGVGAIQAADVAADQVDPATDVRVTEMAVAPALAEVAAAADLRADGIRLAAATVDANEPVLTADGRAGVDALEAAIPVDAGAAIAAGGAVVEPGVVAPDIGRLAGRRRAARVEPVAAQLDSITAAIATRLIGAANAPAVARCAVRFGRADAVAPAAGAVAGAAEGRARRLIRGVGADADAVDTAAVGGAVGGEGAGGAVRRGGRFADTRLADAVDHARVRSALAGRAVIRRIPLADPVPADSIRHAAAPVARDAVGRIDAADAVGADPEAAIGIRAAPAAGAAVAGIVRDAGAESRAA